MTKLQQTAIEHLFTGGYLFIRDRRTNSIGRTFRRYTLYKGNRSPVRIYHERTLSEILKLCKQDAKGKYTLNLNIVRQLRKNHFVKAFYLESKKEN